MAPDDVAAVVRLRRLDHLRPTDLRVPLWREVGEDEVPVVGEHEEAVLVRDDKRGPELLRLAALMVERFPDFLSGLQVATAQFARAVDPVDMSVLDGRR